MMVVVIRAATAYEYALICRLFAEGAAFHAHALPDRFRHNVPIYGLYLKSDDLPETDHVLPTHRGGRHHASNWQLVHRHCHDWKTARDDTGAVDGNSPMIEEPFVLKTVMSGFAGGLARRRVGLAIGGLFKRFSRFPQLIGSVQDLT